MPWRVWLAGHSMFEHFEQEPGTVGVPSDTPSHSYEPEKNVWFMVHEVT